MPSELLEDTDKIKTNSKHKNIKLKRQPRLSETDAPFGTPFLSPDLKYEQNRVLPKYPFLSPPSILETKMMKKPTSTIYLHS